MLPKYTIYIFSAWRLRCTWTSQSYYRWGIICIFINIYFSVPCDLNNFSSAHRDNYISFLKNLCAYIMDRYVIFYHIFIIYLLYIVYIICVRITVFVLYRCEIILLKQQNELLLIDIVPWKKKRNTWPTSIRFTTPFDLFISPHNRRGVPDRKCKWHHQQERSDLHVISYSLTFVS